MNVAVKRSDVNSAEARALICALDAELSAIYPEPGANHFRLEPAEVAPGAGGFFVAWDGDRPIGCGAIRRIDARTGELKRMYVDPGERGRGVSRLILAALEHEGRRLGFARVRLETGTRQMAAQALYTRSGYVRIAAYGEYTGSAFSVCMEKRLAPAHL